MNILKFLFKKACLFTLLLVIEFPHPSSGEATLPPAQAEFGAIMQQVDLANVLDLPPNDIRSIYDSLKGWREKYGSNKNDLNLQELDKRAAHLGRVLSTAARFQDCLKNKNGKGRDILNMLAQLDTRYINTDCPSPALDDLVTTTDQLNEAKYRDFGKKMIDQARQNASENMADMMYRVQDKPGATPAKIATEIAETLCPKQGSRCTKEQKKSIYNAALDQATKLKNQNVASNNFSKTAEAYNSTAKSLNEFFDRPFVSTPDQSIEDAARRHYEDYEAVYFGFTSHGAGLLARTATLRESFGDQKEYKGYKWKKGEAPLLEVNDAGGIDEANKTKNQSSEHRRVIKSSGRHLGMVSAYDIQNARSEYLHNMAMLSVEMEKLANKGLQTGLSSEEMKKAMAATIYAYPMAAAQIIGSDPAYAGVVCDLANQADLYAESLLENKDWWHYATQIAGGGLAVAGVGLTLTGVGAIAGVPMAIAGTALSGVSAGVDLKELFEARSALNSLQRGLSSGNNDRSGLDDEIEVRKKISSEAFHLATDLGFTGMGGLGIIKGLRAMGPWMKATGKNGTEGLRAISNNPAHKATLQALKNQMGEAEIGELAGKLSAMPESYRKQFFAQLDEAVKKGGSAPNKIANNIRSFEVPC